MGLRIRVYARRVTAQHTGWDAARFRADIESTLQEFVAAQADLARRARSRRAGAWSSTRAPASPAASASGPRSAGGGTRPSADSRRPADESALLRACASLELLHASALVHDDYMDASDVRRGRPATHRAFEQLHRERGWAASPEQYGASAAILLGDLLLSWSDELLRTCGLPAERVIDALGYFDLTRSEVVTGQFLDVSAQARGAADVDTAMTVLRYKSAKYSIERPLHIGAALAGADAEQIDPAEPLRPAAGRGLPAARRPARRLRRPVGDRQARRRRPDRGQAHRAGRARARRPARARTPRSSTPRSARRSTRTRSRTCARLIDDSGARLQVEERDQRADRPVADRRSPRPTSATARASCSKGCAASEATQRNGLTYS